MENKIQHQILRLTQKQRKITELVAQGLLNKEIAYAVSLTENTIKAVMQDIFQRNGIKSRVVLAVRFVEEKIHNEIREKQEGALTAIEMAEIRRGDFNRFPVSHNSHQMRHISDHDLERYYLGHVREEPELARLEQHL